MPDLLDELIEYMTTYDVYLINGMAILRRMNMTDRHKELENYMPFTTRGTSIIYWCQQCEDYRLQRRKGEE